MRSMVLAGLVFLGAFAVYQTMTGNGYGTPGYAKGLVRPILGGDSVCPSTFHDGPGIAPNACAAPVPGTPRADERATPAMPACAVTGTPAILATIRQMESGGRYGIGPNAGGASGAYQFISGTWKAHAAAIGRPDLAGLQAYQASPADQDAVAAHLVDAALGGTTDVTRVPVTWYVGHVPNGAEWDTIPAPWAGNVLTPRQYADRWMALYRRAGAPCGGA